MSMPGVPTPGNAQMPQGQKGGRYGFFPELGPVGGQTGIGGTSYAQVGRIPCERGTTNPLNPDPNGILIATSEIPQAEVGELASLKVVQTTSFGAFLGWGLSSKDLLIPGNQQKRNCNTDGYSQS
jgi:hypothetical protein